MNALNISLNPDVTTPNLETILEGLHMGLYNKNDIRHLIHHAPKEFFLDRGSEKDSFAALIASTNKNSHFNLSNKELMTLFLKSDLNQQNYRGDTLMSDIMEYQLEQDLALSPVELIILLQKSDLNITNNNGDPVSKKLVNGNVSNGLYLHTNPLYNLLKNADFNPFKKRKFLLAFHIIYNNKSQGLNFNPEQLLLFLSKNDLAEKTLYHNHEILLIDGILLQFTQEKNQISKKDVLNLIEKSSLSDEQKQTYSISICLSNNQPYDITSVKMNEKFNVLKNYQAVLDTMSDISTHQGYKNAYEQVQKKLDILKEMIELEPITSNGRKNQPKML